MDLRKYEHTKFTEKPNRFAMKLNEFTLDDIEEFNAIYQFAKANYMRVNPTPSGSMPYDRGIKNYFRYMVLISTMRYELVIVCNIGCFRFTIGSPTNSKADDNISGKKAVKKIYELARKFRVDLEPYACSVSEGKKIKETIMSPLIDEYCLKVGLPYKYFLDGDVHHLDLNSSYASRICDAVIELRPIYEYLFERRHEKDGYYKHVLTNHIGCWQSVFCPKYRNPRKTAPYQFAKLSKIAVDGTRLIIEEYCRKLKASGRKVILTNTDGIWYQGEIYHDENEGSKLGQWHNDHVNCQLLVKSKGAYQYVENGVCHTILRGRTNFDKVLDRTEWEFGQILDESIHLQRYAWSDEIGVVEDYGKI